MNGVNPDEFIITRKRKKYRFALFHNNPLCFELDEWKKTFAPTVLEVGAGTGLFSVAMAEQNSDVQFLAVDVKADRLQTGARAATDGQLTNLRFLRARADQLQDAIDARSLDTIWITFPDPFPKDRMAKHRLTHSKFLEGYQRLLRPEGVLYFKTDAKDLFDWSLEQLVDQGWNINELSFDLHNSDLPDEYKVKTTYETRYTSEGLKINFVRALPPAKVSS